jgi:hypothetical protein
MITHLTDDDLKSRIQSKLAVGALSRTVPTHTFGGLSTGQRCSGCDEPIAARETEIEPSNGASQYFHVRCYHILTAERARSS